MTRFDDCAKGVDSYEVQDRRPAPGTKSCAFLEEGVLCNKGDPKDMVQQPTEEASPLAVPNATDDQALSSGLAPRAKDPSSRELAEILKGGPVYLVPPVGYTRWY
jgi:hypothetical protein